MLIRIDGEPIDDIYALTADDGPLGDGPLLVTYTRALHDHADLVGRPWPFGVRIPNTVLCDQIAFSLNDAALLAIDFPTFADGRGFSLGRRLRLAGFAGTLRAVGPLIPDQIRHCRRVGFNEISIPNEVARRHSVADWRVASAIISGAYQDGYGGDTILERRRIEREKARA